MLYINFYKPLNCNRHENNQSLHLSQRCTAHHRQNVHPSAPVPQENQKKPQQRGTPAPFRPRILPLLRPTLRRSTALHHGLKQENHLRGGFLLLLPKRG